jgi:hypothetical protein
MVQDEFFGSCPVDQNEISLFDGSVRKLLGQNAVTYIVLCHDEYSRGSAVEAVNDPRSSDPTNPAQVGAVVEERVDEGPRGMSGCRMNDHVRRFVEYQQILILVEDVQGNGFRLRLGRLGGWHFDLDCFAGVEEPGRTDRPSVHTDKAFVDPTFGLRPAGSLHMAGDAAIDAEVLLFRSDSPSHGAGSGSHVCG